VVGMSSELKDFLYALATDGRLLMHFEREPEEVLAGSKLSEHDRSLVLSADQSLLSDAIGIDPPPPTAVSVSMLDS
jgi:hypothetical protein